MRGNEISKTKAKTAAMAAEKMVHFGHPQHALSKEEAPDVFTCSGCKEAGAGKRYTCRRCKFQLHEFCALAPQQLNFHPFHPHHQLLFYSKPAKGGGMRKSGCDICEKPTKGYAFHCRACSFQMHPCCAMLSPQASFTAAHPHPLTILPSPSAGGVVCGECKTGKRAGRVYGCTVCPYSLHAVCAKNMINGLHDNGHNGKKRATSGLATAAGLAKKAAMDFFGGLVEALGEALGEAIILGVARGNRGNIEISHLRHG